MKKLILSVILISLLISVLSGCNGEQPSVDNNPTAPGGENVNSGGETPPESEMPALNVPDKDFNEYQFKVWNSVRHPDLIPNYMAVEEQVGEVWNDSIYLRNKTIEERHNVTVISNNNDMQLPNVRSSILSGILDYDLYVGPLNTMGSLAMEGLLIDQKQVGYFDFEKPWWDIELNKGFELAKKLFISSGAAFTQNYSVAYIMRFNIELGQTYGLNQYQLYQYVRDGEWTVDKMDEIARGFTDDLNGDGTFTWEDRYGIAAVDSLAQAMFYNVGLSVTSKDSDGFIVFNEFNENANNALTKIMSLFRYDGFMLNGNKVKETGLDHAQTTEKALVDGRAFFHATILEAMIRQRDIEAAIGVLPMPKLDERQENYISMLNGAVVMGIPIIADEKDIERIGIIMETMMYESLYSVRDAYVNTVLQHKLLRDDESFEMLDYIIENRVAPDMGYIYGYGGLLTAIQNEIVNGRGNFASTYESLKDRVLAAIDEHNDMLKN